MRPSFDDEMRQVDELMTTGDRSHALHHVVNAIGLAPNRTEWHAPLRRLLLDAALVEELASNPYYGSLAARAFYLHGQGELAEAITIVAQIHAALPALGFEAWLAEWLDEAFTRSIAIAPDVLLHALRPVMTFGVGRLRLLPAEIAAADAMTPIVHAAAKLQPASPMLRLIGSAALRRANRCDDALAVLEPLLAEESVQLLTTVGLALRAKRDFAGALAAFDRAFAIGNDPVHLLEQMRVLADAGRWDEALEAYRRFSSLGTPDRENGLEQAEVARLQRAGAALPAGPPLDRIRRLALGHGALLPMLDATANALRQVGGDPGLRAKNPAGAGASLRGGSLTVAIKGNEAASNRLCLALVLTGAADPRAVSYALDGDPVRRVGGEAVLWRIDGDVAVPALPAPQQAVTAWVEQLALPDRDGRVREDAFETDVDFLDLWDRAGRAPLPRAPAREWLAAMVHPTMPVFRAAAGPEWLYLWQTAAAIGLAHSEPGWDGTDKRAALLAVLGGELDWPIAAAIRVAAEIAVREPAATADLRDVLTQLTHVVPDQPNGAITRTLALALSIIPYVHREAIERLSAHDAEPSDDAEQSDDAEPSDDDEPDDGEADDPPEPPPRAKPWWRFWGR